MRWTDQTIEINCAECGADIEGKDAMLSHLFDFHPSYTPQEAVHHVDLWLEEAYEREEENERNYHAMKAEEPRND